MGPDIVFAEMTVVIYADDPIMIQRRDCANFVSKGSVKLWIPGSFSGQNLDGDIDPVLTVLASIDGRHAPLSQRFYDFEG